MGIDRGFASPADRVPPTHRAWVEIDLAAIRSNVQAIRRLLAPSTQLMSVVKADGYGHGAVAVARTALSAGASSLAVATLEEGIILRRAGIEAPILLFGPAISKEEVEAVVEHRLQPTVCSLDQARRFSEAGLGTIRIHLKVDTGMSRLGVAWQEAYDTVSALKALPNVSVASLYSHLATADAADQDTATEQCRRFAHLVNMLVARGTRPPLAHLANSAATLAIPRAHFDLVRIGLAQYGIHPAFHLHPTVPLQPALSVKAKIVFIKTVRAGIGVSYGHTYQTGRPTRLATVAIGYGDGVFRALSNRIDLLLRGRRVRQVGTITMDQCLIDVTEVPEASEGDTTTLLGEDGTERVRAGDWAERLGTIPYEVLTALSARLPRMFRDG
ncbi:MAG TPA: alanine racemase [Candidatus Methylomirabilis sp.]|nr:alanine racemase [Candidatus Methylomirabilis sp.]